ncbi:MAG: hypothetical protein ACLFTQ_02740 [Candidatus Aenigmatarchaeota archaeon]
MAFVREKQIAGNTYLYLVESIREGDNVRQKVLKYLGPRDKVSQTEINRLLNNES